MNEMIKYIPMVVIATFSIVALITDIKRNEIDHWVSILGAFICLFFVGYGLDHSIYILKFKPLIHFEGIPITLWGSLISAALIFALFLLIPVGGGDMKFLTFIAFYFGFVETLLIFVLACFITFFYSVATRRIYIKKHPEIFEKCGTRNEVRGKLMRRKMPLMIGICPATIIALILMLI